MSVNHIIASTLARTVWFRRGCCSSAGAEGWLTAPPPQAAGSGGRPLSPSSLREKHPALEPKPGRKEVPLGFAVRFQRQKQAKRSTQRRRDGSGVRRARVQEPTAVESS